MKKISLFIVLLFILNLPFSAFAADDIQPDKSYAIENGTVYFEWEDITFSVYGSAPHTAAADESGCSFTPEGDGKYVIEFSDERILNSFIELSSELYGVESVNGNLTVTHLYSSHGSFPVIQYNMETSAIRSKVCAWLGETCYIANRFNYYNGTPFNYHTLHLITDTPMKIINSFSAEITSVPLYDETEDAVIYYETIVQPNRPEWDHTMSGLQTFPCQVILTAEDEMHPVTCLIYVKELDLIPETLHIYKDIQYGDIDGDGTFTFSDIAALSEYLSCAETGAVKAWRNADLNQNGRLEAVDLSIMKQISWYYDAYKREKAPQNF